MLGLTHSAAPRRPAVGAVACALLALAACSRGNAVAGIGDADRGAGLIVALGCGTCHTIPGIRDATGRVGPSLSGIGEQTIIAGILPNTPANMVRWLKAPQSIVPGNAMPNMELNDHDAHDVAAYLYSLR